MFADYDSWCYATLSNKTLADQSRESAFYDHSAAYILSPKYKFWYFFD